MPPGTHTQKAGTGGGPGVRQVRAGLPRPWRANPGAKCAAPAPHPPWPPCPHPWPARQPCPGLNRGFSSASGTQAALSDQRDSQRRAAVATAPEGLADLRPRGSGCSSPTRGPAHRRRSIPLRRSSPPLNKGSPPTALSPRAMGSAEGSVCLGRWVRDTRTNKVASSQSETHRHLPVHIARSRTLHGTPFPVPAAPRPKLRPFLSCRCRERREEDGDRTWGGLALPCAQEGALFSEPGPGSPK